MPFYNFIVRLSLPQDKAEPSGYIRHIEGSVCEDALLGVGCHGVLALDFCRWDEDRNNAISNALDQLKTVVPNTTVIEII